MHKAAPAQSRTVDKVGPLPNKRFLLVLLGFWFLLYGSFTLINPPLLDDADSVHAEVAREMLARHDYVTLYADGIRYLEKAPLLYWSIAASYRVLGVSELATRLPIALYVLGLCLGVFVLGRRLFSRPDYRGSTAGFYAALILLTSFGMFIFTHITLPDGMVCLWTTVAVAYFWQSLGEAEGSGSPGWGSALGFAAACGLNVLTKGLIGVVFPVAIVVVFLLVTRNMRHLLRWHIAGGTALFLLIAAPWHIAAAMANPSHGEPGSWLHPLLPTPSSVHGWTWFYFVNEHLLRFLNLRVPRDYDTVPLLLFWGLLFAWLMPWIAFVFKALGRVPWRAAASRHALTREQQAWTLLAIWTLVPLVFFSFSTRQEYYVLPSLVPLALLIGGWLAQDEEADPATEAGLAGRRIAFVLMVMGVVLAGVAAFLALRAPRPSAGVDLAAVLRRNPADYALSFGHFMDLSGRAMGFFRGPLLDTAAALFVGTLGNFYYRLRGNARFANLFLAGMSGTFLLASHLALQTFAPVLSSQQLAAAIHRDMQEDDVLEINGEYEAGSTMSFYLDRQARILNGRSANLWYGSYFPDAPQIFDDEASFEKVWVGDHRVFLWTETDRLPKLPGAVFVIAESGGKEIVSNEPNGSGASF